jgi:hypothetical protein
VVKLKNEMLVELAKLGAEQQLVDIEAQLELLSEQANALRHFLGAPKHANGRPKKNGHAKPKARPKAKSGRDGNRTAQIVAFLKAHPDSGPAAIADGIGMPRGSVGWYVGQLMGNGTIKRRAVDGKGTYSVAE